jgi:2-polyprenyl-6-methoxyphenol hydroxylase-like FAD-dependent oxidoreductase
MPPRSGSTALETLRPGGQVHVLGAGPVGLLITALLQSMDGMSVHLYEKRPAYTRTRMVTLAQYLVADSVAGYRTDDIDGESVDAIFDPAELVAGPADHPFARTPVFLLGDAAIGSPYFQSISLGLECAMFLAGLLEQRNLPIDDMLDRYELYIYKQWLRVYMRSKMIKHNKDLLESIDDRTALLSQLHIY